MTGLGAEQFDTFAAGALAIQHVLSSHAPEDAMIKWHPGSSNGFLHLDISNRWFTRDRDGDDLEMPIPDDLDPFNILRSRMSSRARYTAENEVLYYERVKSKKYVQYIHIGTSADGNSADMNITQSNPVASASVRLWKFKRHSAPSLSANRTSGFY